MSTRLQLDLAQSPELARAIGSFGIGDRVDLSSMIIARDDHSITLEIETPPSPSGGRRGTILIVDDDRLCQKMLSRVFTNAGHETLVVGSIKQAWVKLREHVLVDMIVLDNQLDQEWGWQLLWAIRGHPVHKGVPVIVHTGHTERDSIVRMLELQVQSVNLKPAPSEVLLAELQKAFKVDWPSRVIEPTEAICARSGLTPVQYGAMLATAEHTITEKLRDARERLTAANNTQLLAALTSIEHQCRTVGIIPVDEVIAQVKRKAAENDVMEAVDGLGVVEDFVTIIRQRMHRLLALHGSVAQANLQGERPPADQEEVAPASSYAALAAREILSKPLWRLGSHLRSVVPQPLMSGPGVEDMVRRLAALPVFSAMEEALRQLEGTSSTSTEAAVAFCWETKGFTRHYQAILERVTGARTTLDSKADLQAALHQHGQIKLVLAAALMRLAARVPRVHPLNLQPLVVHTFTAALTAFEIGRLLRVTNSHLLPAAGLAHEAGRWAFALGEPGIAGVAWSLAADGSTSIGQAEQACFGLDHQQAGAAMLRGLRQSELLQAAALHYHDPRATPDPAARVLVTVTHLGNLLATLGAVEHLPEGQHILAELRQPRHHAWTTLASHHVSLPFEPPEMAENLKKVALTARWIAQQLWTESV